MSEPPEGFRRKHPLAHCEDCPLYEEGQFVPTVGPARAKLAVVGEAPGVYEAKVGEPFVGDSGQLLNRILRHHKIDRKEIVLSNACLCRQPDGATPTAQALAACRPRLIADLRGSGVHDVVALGNSSAQSILRTKVGITKLRIGQGQSNEADLPGARVVCTFHPAAALRQPDFFPSIITDFGKLKGHFSTWYEPTWRAYDEPEIALQALAELQQIQGPVTVDIEVGIEKDISFDQPARHVLLCVGLGYTRGKVAVIGEVALRDKRVLDTLLHYLQTHPIKAQNGKFDLKGLYPKLGAALTLSTDTMLKHYCTDERRGIHDLEYLGIELLGAPPWKGVLDRYKDRSDSYAAIPRPVLYKYNAFDVHVTDLVDEVLDKKIASKPELRKLHEFLCRASDQLMYCLVPGTRILTQDLRWVPVEELSPGMSLVSVQEQDVQQMLPGRVVSTGLTRKICYEITTDRGVVRCSWDHKWPVRRVRPYRSPVEWRTTKQLAESKAEWHLLHFVEPWKVDNSREAGYLAGIYDGEGCLIYANGGKNRTLQFGQNPGTVLDAALQTLRNKGFHPGTYGPYDHQQDHNDKTVSVQLSDKREVLRALGQLRPARLLAKSDAVWIGRRKFDRVKIQSIVDVGEQDVVSLETDTRTFIAEGFVTHNTELNGIAVDLKYNSELAVGYDASIAILRERIQNTIPQERWEATWAKIFPARASKVEQFNPNSPVQVKGVVKDIFGYRLPMKMNQKREYAETTDAEALDALLEKSLETPAEEFFRRMLEHRKEAKLYGTYVKGLRRRVHHGRVYPTFLLHGTTTGRLSCRNPNLQNIPRDSAMRRQFVPSKPENVFVEGDFAQAELRVLCWLAQDEYLRGIFNDPTRDLFNELTPRLYGDTSSLNKAQMKELRIRVKAYVYGLAYGREAMSIALEFGIPVAEAERGMRAFFNVIPATVKFREETRAAVLAGQDLVTPAGRHRRFWLITGDNRKDVLNEALAFKPQSIASDICLDAFVHARPALKGIGYIRNIVHDSQLVECHESRVEEVKEVMQYHMLEAARRVVGDYVKFKVDFGVGHSWGELS